MTSASALEGGDIVEKWIRVLISWVIMYVTRGEGVQKSEIFMDVIDGSPLGQFLAARSEEEGERWRTSSLESVKRRTA